MSKVKNRWLVAASAVGIHLSIGSVYAWSVYTKPLIEKFGWSLKETQFTFSLAIFCLGLSAAFLGHFLEKYGPRKSGLLTAILFGLGIVGSGLAVHLASLPLLYVSYGIIGGVGLGIGYITPVATLVKWFPDKRGLATGLAIMGFGFAALVSGPLIVKLIATVGIANTFFIMGSIYFVVIFASSRYLTPPPEGWLPEGMKVAAETGKKEADTDLSQLSANEAIKTRRFWYLWTMLFINISCGIAIISAASPMAQEVAGLSPVAAAAMVGFMGIFNGGGRIGWSSLSDYVGRPNTFSMLLGIQILAFLLIPNISNAIIFQAVIFLIISCYGGGYSTLAAYIGDMFGTKEIGAILGYILTAWAAAGLAGPLFAAMIRTATNSYNGSLYCFAGLLVVALIISFMLKKEIKKLKAEKKLLEELMGDYVDMNVTEFMD
ncbi:L-lactate MFS transporter [Mucilaginibacter paludis]|uniref:Major facilitator superfamily MFS_1 n=1 Tax=Mucilaginibacter paludis DSM 18603 TaxID=714943 RepID=H1Y8R5_9SPHI|nr:OFA family MFS transporter [Mucilaginibacter paludis]EHQ26937.1 major facilitator superfamily MFS_1 [Mucilaginibacter paludis DSM 18603]